MGTSPGTQMVMDDFDGDNFDHTGLGFLGGCKIQLGHADGRPISYRPTPPGTPRWGTTWKKATAKWYQHAARITLSGSGTLGEGNGTATFALSPTTDGVTLMRYSGEGEMTSIRPGRNL